MKKKDFLQAANLPALRILLAEGDRCIAESLAEILAPHAKSVEIVTDGISLVKRTLAGTIDLVITDIALPLLDGLHAMQQVRGSGSDVLFIVLSMHDDPAMTREALLAGCNGYVLKQVAGEELFKAIVAVAHGYQYLSAERVKAVLLSAPTALRLSRRQNEIMDCVAQGFRTAEIAVTLGISARTVESHRQTLLRMFQVHNTVALIREAQKQGLVHPWPLRQGKLMEVD